MNCEQMQQLFSPYMDKMTNTKESEAVEMHLQECPHCQRQLEQMGRMCALLKNLDSPQVPLSFAADIHEHLSNEKIKHFPDKEIITPRRTGGWIAAAVAGIALSVGIFASSYLPYGAMVASLQDWLDKDNKPSVAAVDNNKIIQKWIDKQLQTQDSTAGNDTVAPAAQTGSSQTTKPGNKSTGIAPAVTKPVEVAVKERVEQNYTTKIQVDNMEESMQDVMQVAYASGAQISVKSSSVMAAASTGVKVVTLQVPKDKAGGLLSSLGALGVGTPVQNNITYTQAYTNNQKTLSSLEQNINTLQSSASLNVQQQTQLQALQQQKQDLQAEQDRIDKEVGLVTIEVRMLEKTNP